MTDPVTTVTEPIMQGGLGDPMVTPDQLVNPAVSPQEQAPAPQKQKFIVGSRSFDSAEEALAYANGLAESQARAGVSFNKPEAEPTPAQAPHLGQLIFENPNEAVDQIIEKAASISDARRAVVDETNKFWQDFYTNNPDLKGSELLVDAVLAREQTHGVFKGMNRTQQIQNQSLLVAQARAEVSKIKNVPTGGQALPSKPAVVAGTSGASTPQPAPQKPAQTNFIQEMAAARKRG